MTMNRKAREEWEKKQAEAERLRRLNEVRTSALYEMTNRVLRILLVENTS
jgi:hypothetical protein